MTERIRAFLKNRTEDGPCLVVDLDVVRGCEGLGGDAVPRAFPLRAMGTRKRLDRRTSLCCLGLDGEDPVRTAGKMNKPLR